MIREEKFVDPNEGLKTPEELENFSPSDESCEEARRAREGIHDDE